jgi:hypothetical protein
LSAALGFYIQRVRRRFPLDIDLNTIISVASAVAALLSTLYAVSAARSAKRSATVSERQYTESTAGVAAYLIDAVSWKDPSGRQFVAVGCTLSNLATSQTSIVRTELRVHEYNRSGTAGSVILQPIRSNAPATESLSPMPELLNLNGRSTVSGWMTFQIPDNFSAERTIDKYELQFITATDRRTSISTHLMRQVEYASRES